MRIFDCVIYNGEDHLLEIRLNELNDFVDYFVIVESNISFSGIKKKYRFNIKKFQNFENKIRYIQVKDVKSKRHRFFYDVHWQREWGMRDSIVKGLTDCNKHDLIVLSDIDEIPILNKIDKTSDIFIFQQICCQFKFNLLNPGLTPFYGSKAIKYQHLQYPSEFRYFNQDHLGIKHYNHLRKKKISKGGFHFSFCMSNESIIEKLKFYSHYDRVDSENLKINFTDEYLNRCITDKKDIFNGKFNYAQNTKKLQVIPIDSLPKYIQNNQEKFKDYLV